MSVAVSALIIVASSKPKSEGTLRGCVNQILHLRLKFKRLFQLATFRTARNLFAFSSRIEKLDSYHKVAITSISARNIWYTSQPLSFF